MERESKLHANADSNKSIQYNKVSIIVYNEKNNTCIRLYCSKL